MKKKKWKQLIGAGLALLMAVSVVGCGKKEGDGPGASSVKGGEIDKNYVYSYENLDLSHNLDNIYNVFYRNGRVYVVGESYGNGQELYLCIVNEDGTGGSDIILKTGLELELPEEDVPEEDMSVTPREGGSGEEGAVDASVEAAAEDDAETPLEEDVAIDQDFEAGPVSSESLWFNYNYFIMDSKENLYGFVELYHDYEDENGEYTSENTQYLFCWNGQGELQWMQDLSEGVEEEYFYVNNAFFDKEDRIWVYGSNMVMQFDSQGNQIGKNKFTEEVGGSLYMDRKENLFVIGWNKDYTKQVLRKLDPNTLALGSEEECPIAFENYGRVQEGSKYDFILTGSTSVYTYNMEDAQPTKIMDSIDSDLNSTGVYNICLVDDERFVATYTDPVDWSNRIALFTKVPPEEVKDKVQITLAGMYVDYEMKNRIVEFNKTNDTYRIQLRDYQQYSTSEDYMAGYTQLNNDIISGKMPDILVIDPSMPFDSYVAKGLIADLYPFFEKDTEINKEDYLTNIFEAFSVNGKLYQLIPQFSVSAVIGKTSIVGDRTGWNMKEFQDLMASLPPETQSFSEMTKEQMLITGLLMTEDEYINHEDGSCSFDSDGFIQLLELANQFPKELDDSIYDDDKYWESQESAYREDRVILMNTYLSSYRDFNQMEKARFGDDLTLIGFPTESKEGNAISVSTRFALSAKSGSSEGAWEFIRYYMTDEYQNQLRYNFPVKKSALETMEKEAMERPYWLLEDGTKEYYDDSFYMDGVEVKYDPMTAEEAAEFTEFLMSVSMVNEYNQSMIEIVTEEAAAYFEGQKSAQDVAGVIQSRMRIYISENR